MAGLSHLILFAFLRNSVQSQLNDTNATAISTTLSPNTTNAFMTINPTSVPTEIPTVNTTANPIATTLKPTNTPTIEGCSAIHGYIETTTNGQNARQISSYPVAFGPFSYRVWNTSIIGFPPNTADACDPASFNQQDVMDKVVLLDGTVIPNCNYQQITLNLQMLGAKGLLIGLNIPYFNYEGDTALETPSIPTRFIEWKDFFALQNECCLFASNDIRVTLDCFNNSYPSFICIEDEGYGRDDFHRINGQYEQQANYDENGHPVWKQDQIYNIDSNTDWEIFFDTNTFNWVIGEIRTTTNSIVAYCNDTITHNPINCSTWHEKPIWSPYYIKSSTLMIYNGLCPAGDPNTNTTNYCIKSNADDMANYIGTYTQLIEGIPEWFYEDDSGKVAILYWTEIHIAPRVSSVGWKLVVGLNTKAFCSYSDNYISIRNPSIRFYPMVCTEWRNSSNVVDMTFVVDTNICHNETTNNPLSNTTSTSMPTSASIPTSTSNTNFVETSTSKLTSTSNTNFINTSTSISTLTPSITYHNVSTMSPDSKMNVGITTHMIIIYVLVAGAVTICILLLIICFIVRRDKSKMRLRSEDVELTTNDGRVPTKLDNVAVDHEESNSEKVHINDNTDQTPINGNDEKQTLVSNNDI